MIITQKVQINDKKVNWFQTLTGLYGYDKRNGNPFVQYCIKCGAEKNGEHTCQKGSSHVKYPNL